MPELLAPAGDREKLETALHFGADAVYAGGAFSLRADKSMDKEFAAGIAMAHAAGKKYYAAVNIYARDEDFPALEEHIARLQEAGADEDINHTVEVVCGRPIRVWIASLSVL